MNMMNKKLIAALKERGWVVGAMNSLVCGDANLFEDGSSWLILGHNGAEYGRIFDIHNPDDYEAGWTANLILKLVKDSELIQSLKSKIE